MKKFYSVLIAILMIFVFSGCENHDLDEKFFIYYDNKYYDYSINEYYRYNSFWYPLNKADIIDEAFICYKDDDVDKLGKRDEVEIKRFSDEELNMFISHTDFWGDWLYCDTEYDLPDISSGKVEEIVLKKYSVEDEWIDYYNNDKCISIHNKDDIKELISRITYIEKDSSGIKTYQMNEVQNTAEMCVKFEDINALYYVGLLAISEDNCLVFYNAHHMQPLYYLMYDKNCNTKGDFSVLLEEISD